MKDIAAAHFLEAYDQHADALFRYCLYKVNDREQAKDLIQDTYAKVWNCIVQGEDVKNIRAFLYKVLNNLIIDHYRRKKSASLDAMHEDGFEPETDTLSINLEQMDGERARALLRKIPKEYQDVIIMRSMQDLSFKEIAEITGEPENTLTVRYHRGIKKVRTLFQS